MAVAVAARFASAAHMCGVPEPKSCLITVTTTFVLFACACVTRSVSALEFQVVRPESLAMVPLSLTWSPKKATVESSVKFQLG
jgi:hypothetical protein